MTFQSAQPFPHIVLENYFDEEKIAEVIEALAEEEFHEKSSDLFQFWQTQDFKSITNPVLVAFRDYLFSKAFVAEIEKITGLSLNTTPDMFASIYQDTDFLLCHDDQIGTRKVAFLLYLTDLDEKDGGALELYNNDGKLPTTIAKKIIPQKNAMAMFEVSEISFHAVEEVVSDKQRLAITGWYHVR